MILCSLILQLEDGAVDLFLKTIKEDCLEISTKGIQKHRTVDEYVQTWHNEIWEYAYTGWFKGKDVYTKTKAFKEYGPGSQACHLQVWLQFSSRL
jgi:hypothetical protein